MAGDSSSMEIDIPKYAPSGDREQAKGNGPEGEKSVAGRKTMKGGESKDLHSGKFSPAAADKEAQNADETSGKEETVKSKEDHEIETELNSILKKGPSKSLRLPALAKGRLDLAANDTHSGSHHIQQILLSPFCQSQENTSREVHHRTCSLRC